MELSDHILVAGYTGLVGSAIVRGLRVQGYTNVSLCNSEVCNLEDTGDVYHFFYSHHWQNPIKYVFLAAAKVGGIVANDQDPVGFLEKNINIQTNVIQTSYKFEVNKLLFLGSSCIYPRDCAQPIKEEYLLTGPLEKTNESYAIAKIAGIKLCQAYRKQHGFNAISLMPINLYGPNDNFNLTSSHVFPALIAKFHDAKVKGASEVVVWGTGTPRREFMHADDLADAAIFLMNRYDDSEIINIGAGYDLSIFELANLMKKVIGYHGNIVFDSTKPDGTPRKILDVTKITSLGWSPKISLEDGIASTYEWYKSNLSAK